MGVQVLTEVWCVLRSGGDFGPEHVERLAAQVERHGGGRLRCLTDRPLDVFSFGVPVKPMQFDWPGWWSKIELYLQPGPILYLDLDVTIVGDLRPLMNLAAERDFVMCHGFFYANGGVDLNYANSTIVGWCGDQSEIARAFTADPDEHMRRCEARCNWGDQAFALGNHAGALHLWQHELPGAVRSFKREVLLGEALPTSVLASHGRPRPWGEDGADEWLRSRGVEV